MWRAVNCTLPIGFKKKTRKNVGEEDKQAGAGRMCGERTAAFSSMIHQHKESTTAMDWREKGGREEAQQTHNQIVKTCVFSISYPQIQQYYCIISISCKVNSHTRCRVHKDNPKKCQQYRRKHYLPVLLLLGTVRIIERRETPRPNKARAAHFSDWPTTNDHGYVKQMASSRSPQSPCTGG